ncbi:MAG: hypothetical protein Q7U89_01840 [Coriobacteriia bacterium]|nr:hypothetical protein [Coriobacteriia bacterium]
MPIAAAAMAAVLVSCIACAVIGSLLPPDDIQPERPLSVATPEGPAAEASTPSAELPAEVPATPPTAPSELAPGAGDAYADTFINEVKPVVGENLDTADGEVLMARAIDADHKHPEWKMSTVQMDRVAGTDVRTFGYAFGDGSSITFNATPAGVQEGLNLTRISIDR